MNDLDTPAAGSPPLAEPIRVLQLEDSIVDGALELAQLRRAGIAFTSRRVETRDAFLAALEDFKPHVILADRKLPAFDGLKAIKLVQERHPEIPVVVVSGTVGEEGAAEMIRAGARDFVLKDRMGRLGVAVRNALVEEVERQRRAQAERALQESGRRFRALTESMMDLVCIVDASGKLSYVSPSVFPLGGYTPEEVIGRTFLDFVHPDDLAQARADIVRIVRDPASVARAELRLRQKSGSYLVLESVARNALQDPAVQGVVINARDMTARRAAEEQKQAQVERIRAQLEAMSLLTRSEALLAGDVETLARELTEAAARVAMAERANVWLFNEDETELRCIDLFEATPGTHSSGIVLTEAEFRNEFQALKSASHVAADDPLTDPRTAGYVEGYLKPLRITSMLDTVIMVGGAHEGLLCIEHVDKAHHWEPDEIAFGNQLADKLRLCLVNRRRNELTLELQEAQRVARIGHWQLNPATGAFQWSQEINRILGRDPASPALSFGELAQALLPESRARMEAGLAEVMRNGLPHETDVQIVHPAGGLRWIAVRAEPIRNPAQAVVALRGTVQDITELKTTALSLAERVKEQRCLHLVAALGARPDLAEEGLLGEVPALLVLAFQYPEITCARIVHKERVFASPGFASSPWLLASELRVDGAVEGRIEVCYRQERPPATEGPFVAEERALLDTVAVTLGRALVARRLADRLQASKQLLESILNAIPVRVFWKDSKLAFLGCNAPFARDAGFSDPREIIGKDDFQMCWRDQAERYQSDDRQVIESGKAKVLIEEPQTTPAGTVTVLTSKVPLRDTAGEIVGVLGTYMDISERKRAEERIRLSEARLREAQRVAQIGSWELDLRTQALVWSEEIFRIFEIDPTRFSASYPTFLDAIHPDDRAAVNRAYAESVVSHSPYSIDHRLRMQDGRIKFVHEEGQTFYETDGTPVRSVGTVQDITQRHDAEARLHAQLAELQRWQDLSLDREDRILELKREVNRALAKTGQRSRYENA